MVNFLQELWHKQALKREEMGVLLQIMKKEC